MALFDALRDDRPMTASSLPTREQEQELHCRLLAGDKTAPFDLAEAYYAALLHYLRGKNAKHVPDDLLADAVGETWSSLCKKPGAYDGVRPLWAYLRMSAQRDLLNALAKETRRRQHEQSVEDVEQCQGNGNVIRDDQDEIAERNAHVEMVRREILPRVQAGLTEAEVRCLELYIAG